MYESIYAKMMKETIQGISVNDLVGSGDPKTIGESILANLLADKLIAKNTELLEIGCGCGRAAVSIASFLEDGHGNYSGIDIVPGLIEFARREISPSLPKATFYISRENNPLYDQFIHRSEAEAYPTLDPTASFDLIIAFSVFTHLDKQASSAMLREIYCKLRPSGAAVLSWFLIDEFTRDQIAAGNSSHFRGGVSPDGVTIDTTGGPLGAVGYDYNLFRRIIRDAGFDGIFAQHNGFWRSTLGRQYQDVVVLKKNPGLPDGFDWEHYRDANPDVRANGINPSYHWRAFGRHEGRLLQPT